MPLRGFVGLNYMGVGFRGLFGGFDGGFFLVELLLSDFYVDVSCYDAVLIGELCDRFSSRRFLERLLGFLGVGVFRGF